MSLLVGRFWTFHSNFNLPLIESSHHACRLSHTLSHMLVYWPPSPPFQAPDMFDWYEAASKGNRKIISDLVQACWCARVWEWVTKPVDCPGRLLTVRPCQRSTGVSLQCYKCSGSLDDCNTVTAEKMTCLAEQDRCSSLMITKDGETNVVLGCASENDCLSAENTCVLAEKDVRTTCKTTCCQSEDCNTPPEKGTMNWKQVWF